MNLTLLQSKLSICLIALSSIAFAGTPRQWEGDIEGVATWVTVVPRGHEITQEALKGPWTSWGNVETDAYLFAFEKPTDVRLILAFETVNGLPEAKFYVNQRGMGVVGHQLLGDQLTVNTAPFYHLKAENGGWMIDGLTNYNLLALMDGVSGKDIEEPDGVIDFERRVGAEILGEPSWTYNKMVNDPHPSWGYPRYGIGLRMDDAPKFEVQDPLIPAFPHFGLGLKPSHWF